MATRRVLTCCILGAAAWSVLPKATAWAQGTVSVEVRLSTLEGTVGERLLMQVDVSIQDNAKVSEPIIPQLEGLTVQDRGTTNQQMRTVFDGRRRTVEASYTYSYIITPLHVGEYELNVTVRGSKGSIGPKRAPVLVVRENEGGAVVAEPGNRAMPENVDGRNAFVVNTFNHESVYVGQGVVYKSELWSRYRDAQLQPSKLATFKDFWTEDLPPEEPRRDRHEGRAFEVRVALHRLLFPLRAGKLTVGASEIEVYQRGFFGSGRLLDTADGMPLEIDVKPLPAKGQPKDFPANNVGKFRVRTQIDRKTVKQGDGFTLTVELRGQGNLRFVEPEPWPEIEGARRYDPSEEVQVSPTSSGVLKGVRSYQFLIIADKPGTIEIPPHQVRYFDPSDETYKTAASKPIQVEVQPDEPGTDQAVKPPKASEPSNTPQENIKSAVDDSVFAPIDVVSGLGRTAKQDGESTLTKWATGVLAAPATVGLGWSALRLYEKFGPDDVAKARAAKLAERKDLQMKAQAAVANGEGFYPVVADLLHTKALARAGEEGVGLARGALMRLLGENGVSQALVEELKEMLDACDAARFGALSSDASARKELFDKASALIDSKGWKKS